MEEASLVDSLNVISSESVSVVIPQKKVNKKSSCWKIESLPIIDHDENKDRGERNEENNQNQPNIPSPTESFENSSTIEVIVDHDIEFIDNLNASNESTNSIPKKKSSIERGDNLLNDFFHNVEINGKRILANCASCEKSYKADFSSMSNLRGHLKVTT